MTRFLLTSLIVVGLAGCMDREPAGRAKQPPAGTTAPPAAKQTPPARSVPAVPATPGAKAPAAVPEEKPAKSTSEKAQVGVGEKGRGYPAGMYAAKTYWAIQERLAFDLVDHAMQLFKASEGRAPKDNAEFMQRIIKENMIKLPELPAGDRYEYDPKTEELMVVHPAS
ncbi:MAG: hypothetical protein LLG00_05105 [Planctomycetaceae bacterium]|nr:hypothetical protein [Planctomycetaceae bacterium]